MPVSKKEQELSTPEPIQRDVEPQKKAPTKKHTGKPYTPKRTLNLRMKERTGMKPEWFCLALALIMAVALVIEYFGVYRRYEDLAEAEAHLEAEKQKLEQTMDEISDIQELRDWFNQYSYKDYDNAMQDKITVMNMIEDRIFKVYPEITISGLTLRHSNVTFSIVGLKSGEREALYNSLSEEELIASVIMTTIRVENGISTVSVNIQLNDREGRDQGGEN